MDWLLRMDTALAEGEHSLPTTHIGQSVTPDPGDTMLWTSAVTYLGSLNLALQTWRILRELLVFS